MSDVDPRLAAALELEAVYAQSECCPDCGALVIDHLNREAADAMGIDSRDGHGCAIVVRLPKIEPEDDEMDLLRRAGLNRGQP